MGEKRKPVFTMLLKKEGKKKSNKIELFDGRGFGYKFSGRSRIPRYRLRVNGKWYSDKKGNNKIYFTKWEFRDILFKSLDI